MNTITIKPLSSPDRTVTLRRRDDEAMPDALEAAHDKAVFDAFDAKVTAVGWEGATADLLPTDLAERWLAGESPVRIWPERRGMTARALARAVKPSPSCIADIGAGRRKGTAATLAGVAAALKVDLDTPVAVD